ncbi:hypothetical protein D9M69_504500 [compost metagenome]
MDGWLKIDPLLLERAAIDADVEAGQRQMPVLAGKPSIAKPVEIVDAAGPELVDDLAGVVADRLAVRPTNRDLLGPEPVLCERSQRRHQMHMRIAGGVVVDPVRRHALGRNLSGNKISHEVDVLLRGQFERQGNGHILGELRIGALLELFDLVPEGFRGAGDLVIGNHRSQPVRCIGGDDELLMQQARLAGVIDRPGLALVVHLRAVPVGRRQHGAAAGAAGDDADGKMRDGHG